MRQVSRFLDSLLVDADHQAIQAGLELSNLQHVNGKINPSGKLYLQTRVMANQLPENLPGKNVDNSILATTLSLQEENPNQEVILVSKDINLRIKAHVLGIPSEDYFNDKVLDDADLLYSGQQQLDHEFWEQQQDTLKSWQDDRKTYYEINSDHIKDCFPYLCVYSDDDFEALVEQTDEQQCTLRVATDYRNGGNVWGVNARNREQNFALNLLMIQRSIW